MKILILDTGVDSAIGNMSRDEKILSHLAPNGSPILHLYQWKQDSLTYGYFAKPEKLLDPSGMKKHSIDCARRITGGGVTLHFIDFAFSFFMPRQHPHFSENTLENYAFVNKRVSEALRPLLANEQINAYECISNERADESFFFCMAKPTRYDVMVGDKKVGGAAQRKTTNGYLHHGTIALAKPDLNVLNDILREKEKVVQAMLANSYYLIDNHLKRAALEELREEIKVNLIRSFNEM
ncbi:MAG: Octanoyltransferase LipM [Chlamydiae bacterium]|nr:Octanoyltransferase LipM [Chlamydiota bacterium]